MFYAYHLYHCRRYINPADSLVISEDDKHLVSSSDLSVQIRKHKLRQTFEKIRNLRFIYGSYLPKHMYFEVVDCIRRLFLTALPILFLRSTVMQVVIVLVISLIFTTIYLEFKPFISPSDNRVAISCQWAISLVLIATLCLRVDATEEVAFGPTAIVSVLFFVLFRFLMYEV